MHVTEFLGMIAAWAPYFDDMNAIIFLAPISCFDQVLQEDPSVNRLVRRLVPVIPWYLIRPIGRFIPAVENDRIPSTIEEDGSGLVPQQM